MKGWGRSMAVALLGLVLQAAWLPAHAEEDTADDPPSRAARLTALSGDVGLRSAGDNDWSTADENRPLTTGDALDLSSGARAEVDFGGAQVRLDGNTQAYLDRLDDNVARFDVRSGTASLDVDDVGAGTAYELRTPTIAFAPSGAGTFRVDVDQNGVTTLTLIEGEGTVYGNNGQRYDVHGNQAYRFEDSELRNVVGLPRPERDGFDRWVADREGRYDDGPSRQYVAEGMAGTADLNTYGRWESADDYGPVWYPTTVVVDDWAPYRYGRWTYVRPWGWTWIDDAPWGYAPFHYGRWVHLRNRWGWVPGPRYVRPVYSPALVGFVGGSNWGISVSSGPPVGWFPLGPRDVYCPPYRYSRNYFQRVNVTNVTINRTVINNTYENVHVHNRGNQVNYTYRNNNHATTVASRDDFENGRRVGRNNRIRVSNDQLASASLTANPSPTPPRGQRNNRGDDRPTRFDRPDNRPGTPPSRDDRPDRTNGNRGNAQVGSRARDDDRGGFGSAPARDDRPDRGNSSRDRPSRDDATRDESRTTRPMTPSDDRPSTRGNASNGSNRRPSNGNDASNDDNRRMWSTQDRNADVRYAEPPAQPSRAPRSDRSPDSSNSRGTPPRQTPSQPSSQPSSMNRGGDRSNPSGRPSQGPTRNDNGSGGGGGGRASHGGGRNDQQARGQGNGRDERTRN